MEKNEEILKEREALFNKQTGIRLGDFLKRADGTYTRFTVMNRDRVQTGGERGAYYLSGNVNYSCGFCYSEADGPNPGVIIADLRLTGETRFGEVWFFDRGIVGPGRRVDFQMEFRVYELSPGGVATALKPA